MLQHTTYFKFKGKGLWPVLLLLINSVVRILLPEKSVERKCRDCVFMERAHNAFVGITCPHYQTA